MKMDELLGGQIPTNLIADTLAHSVPYQKTAMSDE
jgi:hypothetical protein